MVAKFSQLTETLSQGPPTRARNTRGLSGTRSTPLNSWKHAWPSPAINQPTPPKGKPTKLPPNADCNYEEETLQTSVEQSENDNDSEENLY